MVKWYLSFVLCAISSFASVVYDVKISGDRSRTRIVLLMNEPTNFPVDQENDENVVIETPATLEWKAADQGRGKHLVESWYFERYSNKTGDVVFEVPPGMKILKKGPLFDGKSTQGFYVDIGAKDTMPSEKTKMVSQAYLLVRDIKFGVKDDFTRVVLELNKAAEFDLKEDVENNRLIITPLTTETDWDAKDKVQKSIGRFRGYTINEKASPSYVELSLLPSTTVERSYILDTHTRTPKFVIDLRAMSKERIEEGSLFDKMEAPLGVAKVDGMDIQYVSPDKQKMESPIRGMRISEDNGSTVVTITATQAVDFPVTDNDYTHQIIMHLPKTAWDKVDIAEKSGGLIKSYSLDQSSPSQTKLIFSVEKGTNVIGKKSSTGTDGDMPSFVLYLDTDEAKVPEWLSKASTERLAYEKTIHKKDELKTTTPIYRGGITPYTNVGEGLYMGVSTGYTAGRIERRGSRTGAFVANELYKSATPSANVSGHIGYGIQFLRHYAGLEAFAGYQFLSMRDKNSRYKYSMREGFYWGSALRYGYYISPMALLYAKVGAQSSGIDIKGSDITNYHTMPYGNVRRNGRTSFIFGVGIEAVVTDHMSVRLEMESIKYQTFRSFFQSGGVNTFAKYTMRTNRVNMGISYKLRPMSGPLASPIFAQSVPEGLYIGGAFGMATMESRTSLNSTLYPNTQRKSGAIDPVWGIFLGYTMTFGQLYLAPEYQVTLNESRLRETLETAAVAENYNTVMKWSMALSLRPGYIFNHGVVGYGRLGVVTSRFAYDNSGLALRGAGRYLSVRGEKTKTLVGVRFGGGLEVFMSPLISVRADTYMDYFPSVKVTDSDLPRHRLNIQSMRSEFTLGVAYTLPVQ